MPTPSPDFLRLAAEARSRIREVDPAEARRMREQGVMVLDVRDRHEFEEGHLPGAVNVSRGTLEVRIHEAIPDKATPVIVHCAGGNRGALAVDTLQRMGYTNAVNLAGGLRAYREATGED